MAVAVGGGILWTRSIRLDHPDRLGVGFGVSGALVSQVYEGKGSTYWLINGANAVIAYAIVGAILAVWD